MSDTAERAARVFREIFSQPDLRFDRSLTAFDVDGWDSLRNIQLLFSIGKEFKIKFRPGEVVKLRNLGDLLDLIDAKRSSQANG